MLTRNKIQLNKQPICATISTVTFSDMLVLAYLYNYAGRKAYMLGQTSVTEIRLEMDFRIDVSN